MAKAVYRAAFAFPVSSPVIENGFVETTDGIVTGIGHASECSGPSIDLGDVALLPGWVNAHTHLEFSQFDRPFGEPGIAFTDWVRGIVGQRFSRQPNQETIAINQGLAESARTGTAALGEIATSLKLIEGKLDSGVDHTTLFFESLGRDPAVTKDRLNDVREKIKTCRSICNASNRSESSLQTGISPHAPYSVHPKLLDGLIDLAVQHDLPVAMHLAETRDELQLLDSQSGPMVQMLEDFQAWFPESFVSGERPLDYLRALDRAPHSLIIHGNYLHDDELDFIGQRADKMHVVFCPRTHAFFDHDPYPLNKMLDRGINVALGTDSRGSNPDLNLLREIQQVARSFPRLVLEQLLRMGTFAGAMALRQTQRFGSLAIGCSGINVANLKNGPITKDESWILDPDLVTTPISEFVSQ